MVNRRQRRSTTERRDRVAMSGFRKTRVVRVSFHATCYESSTDDTKTRVFFCVR